MSKGRDAVIREIMSMLDARGSPWGYQAVKDVVLLAAKPEGTWQKVGPRKAGYRRPMIQAEAERLVAEAKRRIAAVDELD